MIRKLPIVIVLAALGAALQAWGSEQEVTPAALLMLDQPPPVFSDEALDLDIVVCGIK